MGTTQQFRVSIEVTNIYDLFTEYLIETDSDASDLDEYMYDLILDAIMNKICFMYLDQYTQPDDSLSYFKLEEVNYLAKIIHDYGDSFKNTLIKINSGYKLMTVSYARQFHSAVIVVEFCENHVPNPDQLTLDDYFDVYKNGGWVSEKITFKRDF